ncbi:MAG TPA: hypothetical protein PKB03_10370 [Baekduia sp.]|nr:hypothetical protein [Baekduia sp.]
MATSSVVKDGYGPTLPDLVARLPRGLQWLAKAAGVALLLLALGWVLFGRDVGVERVIVKEPVAFNLGYRAPFQKIEPRGDEILRLEGGGQEFVITPLSLPKYDGYAAGFLPYYSTRLAAQMERARPGLTVRGEGRVSINKFGGYELQYDVREADGTKRYGRRLLLLPDDFAREGVQLWLEADASAAVVNPESPGRTGPLKTALRSFRFGTDVP